MDFGGIFAGGIAKGLEDNQKLNLQKGELGIKSKLADIAQQEVDQKGQQNKNALMKDMIDRAATGLNDAVALGEKIIGAAPDKNDPGVMRSLGIIRGQIEQTATGLSQIPGGTAVGQNALKKFDAIVAGLPSAVDAGTIAGKADAAKITAAQPATTAAAVAQQTALGPVQATNAALTARATAPIAVQQAVDTARATGPVNAANAALQAQAVAPIQVATAGQTAQVQAAGTQAGNPVAQSDQGKQIIDRARFVGQFGEGSPQVQAFDQSVAQHNGPKLSDVAELRKEYMTQSKDFVTVRDSMSKIAVAAQNPSPAGDIAMVFHFMKMLDPTSVVREGEYATAANAAGVPDRIQAIYNKALVGEKLAPAQRADLLNQSENVFRVNLQNQARLETQYQGIAAKRGFDPNEALIDVIGPYRVALGKQAGAASAAAGAIPKLGLDGKLQ